MANESKKVKRGGGSARSKAGLPAKAGKRRSKNIVANVDTYGNRSYATRAKDEVVVERVGQRSRTQIGTGSLVAGERVCERHETTAAQRTRGEWLAGLYKDHSGPYTPAPTEKEPNPQPVDHATKRQFLGLRPIDWFTTGEWAQMSRIDRAPYRGQHRSAEKKTKSVDEEVHV